jgi:hypothetical protein
MNERIRELAEQAGDDWEHTLESDKKFLERFAAIVAAHEREACAKLVWDTPKPDDEYVPHQDAIAKAIRARGMRND